MSASRRKRRAAARREQRSGIRRFLTPTWIAVAVGLIAFVVIIIVVRQSQLPNVDLSQIPDNSQSYPIRGQEHIAEGEEHAAYNSNPPTSGPHYVNPARTGVYAQQLADETLVHNLEHGHIWLSYRDENDRETIDVLSEIQNQFSSSVIVTYRPENDNRIAAAAWGRLLPLDEVDRDQILAFIMRYVDQAPESVPG